MDGHEGAIFDEVEHELGGHPALDRRAGDFAVTLRGMPVSDREQGAGHRHRQVQRRAGDELTTVNVAAAQCARRHRRMLAIVGRRHSDHAKERGERHRKPELVGTDRSVGVQLPEQGRGVVVTVAREPQPVVERVVDASG
jgi:hypothetical protein